MKCPYRKIILHLHEDERDIYPLPRRDREEYCECYREECPFYEEHNICKKVKAEVGLIDG